jgi:hypothetical protein
MFNFGMRIVRQYPHDAVVTMIDYSKFVMHRISEGSQWYSDWWDDAPWRKDSANAGE